MVCGGISKNHFLQKWMEKRISAIKRGNNNIVGAIWPLCDQLFKIFSLIGSGGKKSVWENVGDAYTNRDWRLGDVCGAFCMIYTSAKRGIYHIFRFVFASSFDRNDAKWCRFQKQLSINIKYFMKIFLYWRQSDTESILRNAKEFCVY